MSEIQVLLQAADHEEEISDRSACKYIESNKTDGWNRLLHCSPILGRGGVGSQFHFLSRGPGLPASLFVLSESETSDTEIVLLTHFSFSVILSGAEQLQPSPRCKLLKERAGTLPPGLQLSAWIPN